MQKESKKPDLICSLDSESKLILYLLGEGSSSQNPLHSYCYYSCFVCVLCWYESSIMFDIEETGSPSIIPSTVSRPLDACVSIKLRPVWLSDVLVCIVGC